LTKIPFCDITWGLCWFVFKVKRIVLEGLNMAEEPKKISCPNCLGPASKEGNKIICEVCDATFTFKKTGGAKVQEIGRLDSIEERLDRVEDLLPGQEPGPAEPEPEPAESELEPEEEETSLLG